MYWFCITAGFCCLSKANYLSCFLLFKKLGNLRSLDKTSPFFLMDFWSMHTLQWTLQKHGVVFIQTNHIQPFVTFWTISKFSGDHKCFFSEVESRCYSANQTEQMKQLAKPCPILCTGLVGHLSCQWVAAYGKLSSSPFQPHYCYSDSIRTKLAHWGGQVEMGIGTMWCGEGMESGRSREKPKIPF